MDSLTERVAVAIEETFGDQIGDLYFADIVDSIADAIAATALADAEEALA